MNPETFLAKSVRWQFFASLTFAGDVPPESIRQEMLFAWLHWFHRLECKKGKQTRRSEILWLLREELGEIGARLHYHLLLGGLSNHLVNKRTAMASCSEWERLHGGSARNYIYDVHSDGAAYVLKGLTSAEVDSALGAVNYEQGKFRDEAGRRVWVGNALMWRILTRTSNNRLVTARAMRALSRGS
jgi:hypothetical protein